MIQKAAQKHNTNFHGGSSTVLLQPANCLLRFWIFWSWLFFLSLLPPLSGQETLSILIQICSAYPYTRIHENTARMLEGKPSTRPTNVRILPKAERKIRKGQCHPNQQRQVEGSLFHGIKSRAASVNPGLGIHLIGEW